MRLYRWAVVSMATRSLSTSLSLSCSSRSSSRMRSNSIPFHVAHQISPAPAAAGGGAHSTHRADGPRARQQQRSPSPDAHRSHLTCHSQISLHRLPHTPAGRQTQRKAPVSATTQAGAAYRHMTTTAAGRDRGSYSCQSPRSRPVTCSEGSEPRVGRTAPSGRRS
eukprot:COSAG02_NODE_9135_length_2315_cov_158.984206_2_plen_164_part_01